MDFYKFKCFEKCRDLIHTVTKRSVKFPYDFSMALHTGENEKEIIENRKIMASFLKSDKNLHFIVANQTHSDNIKIISKKKTKGWNSLEDAVEDCDALITNEKDIVLTILTADCVPVLLYDEEKKVVAVIHAGWKGTKANDLLCYCSCCILCFPNDPMEKNIMVGSSASLSCNTCYVDCG